MNNSVSTTQDSWKTFLKSSTREFVEYILDNDTVTALMNWNPRVCFSKEYLDCYPEFKEDLGKDIVRNEPFAFSVIDNSNWEDYESFPKFLIPFITCDEDNGMYYFSHDRMNTSLKMFILAVAKEMFDNNFNRDDIHDTILWLDSLIIYKHNCDTGWVVISKKRYDSLDSTQNSLEMTNFYKDKNKYKKDLMQFHIEKKIHMKQYYAISGTFMFIMFVIFAYIVRINNQIIL